MPRWAKGALFTTLQHPISLPCHCLLHRYRVSLSSTRRRPAGPAIRAPAEGASVPTRSPAQPSATTELRARLDWGKVERPPPQLELGSQPADTGASRPS